MPIRKSKSTKNAPGPKKKSTKAAESKKRSSHATGKKDKQELEPAARRFVRDLLIRGEAASPTADGDLPPGATHKILADEEDDDGLPTVVRERYSIS